MDPFVTIDEPLADRGVGDQAALPTTERDHLEKVLRLRGGAPIVVADGRGWSAEARLDDDRRGVTLTGAPRFTPRPRPALTVLHALPKGRKLDEVVRLLTELDVDRVVPVESEHSVVRLEGERAERAASRWRAVAAAATNQARRPWRCEVARPRPLSDHLAESPSLPGLVAVVGVESSVGAGLARLPDDLDELVLAVGPEGGWAEGEVASLASAGMVPVGLGATVLRTEHAAGILTAVTRYVLGRLD